MNDKLINTDLPMWYCERCKDFTHEDLVVYVNDNTNYHKHCGGIIDKENSHFYMSEQFKIYKQWIRKNISINLDYAEKMGRKKHERD